MGGACQTHHTSAGIPRAKGGGEGWEEEGGVGRRGRGGRKREDKEELGGGKGDEEEITYEMIKNCCKLP